MNLYLIERKGTTDYDEYAGFVIAASNEVEARNLATEEDSYPHGGGAGKAWLDGDFADCKLIATSATHETAQVVLSDFRAG
jgi:hypothetical protein